MPRSERRSSALPARPPCQLGHAAVEPVHAFADRLARGGPGPLHEGYSHDESDAYEKLRGLDEQTLDELARLLLAEHLTANVARVNPLVRTLATELGVNVRRFWRPDAGWLNAHKKCQLAHLVGELRGPVYDRKTAEGRKKSELVEMLAKLFTDAAEGRLEPVMDLARAWRFTYVDDGTEAVSQRCHRRAVGIPVALSHVDVAGCAPAGS